MTRSPATRGIAWGAVGLGSAALVGVAIGGGDLPVIAAGILGMVMLGSAATVVRLDTETLAFGAVSLLVVTVTWNGLRIGLPVVDLVLALALGAVAIHVLRERPSLIFPPWMLLSVLAAGLAYLLVAFDPPDPRLLRSALIQHGFAPTLDGSPVSARSDIVVLVKLMLVLVAIPLAIAVTCTTARRCRRLGDLFVVSALINVAAGILRFEGATDPGVPGRAMGLTNHPNTLALVCSIALPFALMWWVRSPGWRLASLSASATLLLGVYASGSRTGLVAAIVALVVTSLAVPGLRRLAVAVAPALATIVVGILIFTPVGADVAEQLRLTPGDRNAAGSDYQRSIVTEEALTQIRERPVYGTGLGVIGDAHNIYLQMLASGGVILLLGYLAYGAGILGRALVALRGPHRNEAVAASAAVFIWLLSGVYNNAVIDRFIYVAPGLLLALAAVTIRSREPAVPHDRSSIVPDPRPGGTDRGGQERTDGSRAPASVA